MYDSAGNATSLRGHANTYNGNNQNSTNTYDLDGNPTTYGTVSCTFDSEDRLTAYGGVLSAGYTASGRRAWKQTATGRIYYHYAGGIIPVCELDGTGAIIAVNTVGPNGLLARHTAAASTSYAFDPQGSQTQRLDQNGNILGATAFDVYGVRTATGVNADPWSGYGAQWGYYLDIETGLQLLGHRYYDPQAARFLTRDPIHYQGGINLYAYARNTAVTRIDPSGYQAEGDIDPVEEDPPIAEGGPEGEQDEYGFPNCINGAPVLHDPLLEAEQSGINPEPETYDECEVTGFGRSSRQQQLEEIIELWKRQHGGKGPNKAELRWIHDELNKLPGDEHHDLDLTGEDSVEERVGRCPPIPQNRQRGGGRGGRNWDPNR